MPAPSRQTERDRLMVDALREWLGLDPLYAPKTEAIAMRRVSNLRSFHKQRVRGLANP